MKNRKQLLAGAALLIAFTVWTVLIQSIDVQPVGANGTAVGFAAVNTWFHQLTGVHMTVYTVTDWLGLVPIGICGIFGIVGLGQTKYRCRDDLSGSLFRSVYLKSGRRPHPQPGRVGRNAITARTGHNCNRLPARLPAGASQAASRFESPK